MNAKIELQDIVRLIRRKIVLITISSFFCAGLLGVYSFFTSKETYSIQANLVLSPQNDERGFQVQDFTIYEKMLGTYIELGKTEILTQRVNSLFPPEVIQSILSVNLTAKPDSQVLIVTLTGLDKNYLESYMEKYLEVYQELSSENLQEFRLKLLSTDRIKINRVITKHIFKIAVGFFLGISLPIFFVILVYLLQDKVKSAIELSQIFDLPLLGIIPKDKKQEKVSRHKRRERRRDQTMGIIASPLSIMTETYRMLRSHLEEVMDEQDAKVIAITSSIPGEGKTTTSISLAISFAQLGKKVLLIDGDLRKPAVHHYLNLERSSGLSDILQDESFKSNIFKNISLPFDYELSVISAGDKCAMPTEVLESDFLGELLEIVRSEFDVVIIDSPPILAVTDAQVISRQVDGLLLVSDINTVKKSELREVHRILETSFKNVFGLVANKIDSDYHPYYYYEY